MGWRDEECKVNFQVFGLEDWMYSRGQGIQEEEQVWGNQT